MKSNPTHRHSIVAAITLAAAVHAQSGGPYCIDWCTVDGGGVTQASSGGNYTLIGTLGQPDADSRRTGGSYELTGGFWSCATLVPVPNAPELTLQFTANGTQTVLLWDLSVTGWHVETSTDLQTWTPVAADIVDTSTHHTLTVPSRQRAFFRLAPVDP
ncbi:MAG TPA: hypothetical protein VG796_08590 [Verrucomicrobiales bacterium]|nr:hypothetical protein [Verrucomicrobiales bacterium]